MSTGKDPATGKRTQRTITASARRELEAELARIGHAVADGIYRRPWDGLMPELIDSYLANGADQWEASTRLSYANALAPAREFLAQYKARSMVREDIERYKAHLLGGATTVDNLQLLCGHATDSRAPTCEQLTKRPLSYQYEPEPSRSPRAACWSRPGGGGVGSE